MSCASKTDPCPSRDGRFLAFITDAAAALRDAARRWLRRRQTRELLTALDDRQLRDIGLTRDDLASELSLSRAVRARRRLMSGVSDRPSQMSRWWTRHDRNSRALAALGDDELSSLSDLGRQVRREARRDIGEGAADHGSIVLHSPETGGSPPRRFHVQAMDRAWCTAADGDNRHGG
jgi:uncharacterized protein YjiS (DUF1127 family)